MRLTELGLIRQRRHGCSAPATSGQEGVTINSLLYMCVQVRCMDRVCRLPIDLNSSRKHIHASLLRYHRLASVRYSAVRFMVCSSQVVPKKHTRSLISAEIVRLGPVLEDKAKNTMTRCCWEASNLSARRFEDKNMTMAQRSSRGGWDKPRN